MRNERDANNALAATRGITATRLQSAAAAREARRTRKPCTINCLVPFFILASVVYAGVCLYL